MLNHSFNETNLMNKTQDSFTSPVMNENMTDLERSKAMTKISKLEEEAILSYEELLQCAIASEDEEMIALITEITNDERKHVGNILAARQQFAPEVYDQIEQGEAEFAEIQNDAYNQMDDEEFYDVMNDDEEFYDIMEDEDSMVEIPEEAYVIIEKNGSKWKTLATAKNLNEAKNKYNKNVVKTKNEMRLLTLKDLKQLKSESKNESISKKNEAPLDAHSLFTALNSELATIYQCEITKDGFLRCTDDEGNYIEIAFIENTDPIELGMKVSLMDGTDSETVYYAYDTIQATVDFITAVFISEINASQEEKFETEVEEETEKVEKDLEDAKESKSIKVVECLKEPDDIRNLELAIQFTKKYYDEDELAEDLDPFAEELQKRGIDLNKEIYNIIINNLRAGLDLKSAVEDAFKSCKDECGTVSDLGVAPIMPVGSSIFPKEDKEDKINESIEQEQEVENLMDAALEDIKNGNPTAEDWIEDAKYIFNSLDDQEAKNRLANKYPDYLNENLNQVTKDLVKATNSKVTPAEELNKELFMKDKAATTAHDNGMAYRIGFKHDEPVVPIIDQAAMDNAMTTASFVFTMPASEAYSKAQESFKNIDKKEIEDLLKSANFGGLVKYLYESIKQNEDTFTDPQLNQVNPDISNTNASGNDTETPKLADDIDPAPTEVEGFSKDDSEIKNTSNTPQSDNEITKDAGTQDVPTT